MINTSTLAPRPRVPSNANRSRSRAADSNFAWNIVHSLLFSQRRVAFEKHRRHGLRVSAERAVHRYVRRQQQQKLPVIFVEMACIYVQRFARCKPLDHLRMCREDRDRVCQQYTRLVTQLMTAMNLNLLTHLKPDAIATVLLYANLVDLETL